MRHLWTGFLPCLLLLGCEGRREDNSQVMATLKGERLTQDQFSLLLANTPDARKEEVLKNPEEKRNFFNTMLKRRLFSLAAQDDGFGKAEALQRRFKMTDQRMVTQFYYQNFLGEQDGFSRGEIESYYQQHGSLFAGDSGKIKPFSEVRQAVADSLLISKTNLDSVYTANKRKYLQRAYCEVSLIEVKSKKTAEQVHAEIAKGLDFKAAVQKYSLHTSKSTEGRIGHASPSEPMWDLGNGINIDSVFFAEGTKVGAGNMTKPFKKDSTWIIARADSCFAENTPPLAKIRNQVVQEFINYHRSRLTDSALSNLKKKYGVQIRDLRKVKDTAGVLAFYEKNKDSYVSPETYQVYHVEAAKRDLVEKKLKAVKDLGAFKQVAAQFSENTWIKSDSGKSGIIKRDHCLPYGIGMLPSLWSALDTLKANSIAGPYQNPESGKWHWFYLVEKFPRKAKDFARVKSLVTKEFQDEVIAQIKPQDTLATYGQKVVLESDVQFLRQEIPPHMQERYTREQLVDYLLTWDLTTTDGEAVGLTGDPRLMAQRLENVDNYWSGIYQDSVLAVTYAMDTAQLKADFDKNHSVITKDSAEKSWHKFPRDIAGLQTLTEKDFKLEYATYPERYQRDSTVVAYTDAQYDIFQNLKGVAYVRAEKALLDKLKTRFQVVLMDSTLNEPVVANATEGYKQAQNLHYDRKLDQALGLYEKLRLQFPDNVALQDSICFGVAQIYIEQERFQQAMAEYRRVSYLYPQSPNEYKAQFMVGFIQSEHLKQDSAAVRTFDAMLKKYPKTDLSDDADWMIRNIRSGGKLMPVLEGDSGWVNPDSTQKAKTK